MEYYFDYQITEISGDNKVQSPKLYFERSYDNVGLPYCLYAVPQEWIKGDKTYDRIEVVFDLNGIDCAALSDKDGEAYRRAELKSYFTIDSFKENGNRIIINAAGSVDQAGVGIIEMLKGTNSVAKFFFAINFTFRKKIQYAISRKNGKLDVAFIYDGKPRGKDSRAIPVNVVYNKDRLPCLKSDARLNILKTLPLQFSKTNRNGFEPLDLRRQGLDDAMFSVAFANENDEKYFILDCIKNDTIPADKPSAMPEFNNFSCPYCHKPISARLGNTKGYKRGGTSCMFDSIQEIIEYSLKYSPSKSKNNVELEFSCKNDTTARVNVMAFGGIIAGPITLDFTRAKKIRVTETFTNPSGMDKPELRVVFASTPPAASYIDRARSVYQSLKCTANNTVASIKDLAYMPEVYDEHGSVKKSIYCAGDLSENNPLAFEKMRLLPPKFMEHDSFKIAFVGSTRAGKTTYISRLFGITGDERSVSMDMTMSKSALNRFGIDVQAATMALVEMNRTSFIATDRNWNATQEQYLNRAISIDPPRFPAPTDRFDYTGYPFIVEVDGSNYVSFYDIAGEDAQGSRQIQKIANDDPIGIFYIINGVNDRGGNASVAQMLNQISAGINPHIHKCPVAVIVTKMDLIEDKFDSNCNCLRTDYFDAMKKYSGSRVERMINSSSEEIRSYLTRENLLPDLRFDNVKFFGISSFNFTDSIHNESGNYNQPASVNFNCSAKHFELPFIWMMKQFGIII